MLLHDAISLEEISLMPHSNHIKQMLYLLHEGETKLLKPGQHIGFYQQDGQIMQVGPTNIADIIRYSRENGIPFDIIYAFDSAQWFVQAYGTCACCDKKFEKKIFTDN